MTSPNPNQLKPSTSTSCCSSVSFVAAASASAAASAETVSSDATDAEAASSSPTSSSSPSTSTSSWAQANRAARCAVRLLSIFKRMLISLVSRANLFILWDCSCISCTREQREQQHSDISGYNNNKNNHCDNNNFNNNIVIMELLRSQLLDHPGLVSEDPTNTVNGHNGTNNGNQQPPLPPALLLGQNGIAHDQLLLVYSLELNAQNESKLFRCDKYNRIRFHLAPSLFGRNVILFTNYREDYTKFDRRKYSELKISDSPTVLQIRASGSFHFYYVESGKPDTVLGSFYIVASPDLTVRRNDSKKPMSLSVNAIQCQTVLTKCMGPIDAWKEKLKVSINTGYNMIHFTPIQELGASRSAYSLADQHRINPDFRSQSMLKAKRNCRLDDVAKVIGWLREENGVLSLTDIVLNHTANESSWLRKHPEATYNCANCPWLRPAFMLDRLLSLLSIDIENNSWSNQGVTPEVNTDSHLDSIRTIFIENYLPLIKLEEFFLCDIDNVTSEFRLHLQKKIYGGGDDTTIEDSSKKTIIVNRPAKNNKQFCPIKLIQDSEYRRSKCTIDFDNATNLVFNEIESNENDDNNAIDQWIDSAVLFVKKQLTELNEQKRKQINDDILSNAIDNVLKGARYERVELSGPKVAKVSRRSPLATEYFTFDSNSSGCPATDMTLIEQSLLDETKSSFYMAHNGWVMGDDPLKNFADNGSLVYLRRELVCWSDSVKLRFGQKPEDSPFLWSFMEEYVKQMASTFQGLRLDNCHSTPIHVAQYMLDAARRVNPDLYLVAELFTANEEVDNIFVNKLGINSLIREAMSASVSSELGRQVYRYGGEPVGSFFPDILKANESKNKSDNSITLYMRPFVSTVAHAMFFDVTHDNESPIVRRTPYDPLPSSALVSMTYAAIGSNRGLDELVPHHIHVVNEERTYQTWADPDDDNSTGVDLSTGIIDAKRILNQLHEFLGSHGYSQAYVDQRDRDTVVVTRHNPHSHKSVILASRTAFYPLDQGYAQSLKPLKVEGKFDKIIFQFKMVGEYEKEFKRDPLVINGYRQFYGQVNTLVDPAQSEMIELEVEEDSSTNLIKFKQFPPSSVLMFSMTLLDNQMEALNSIKCFLKQYDDSKSEINFILSRLDLIDINYVLFRCNQEEMDETGGHGVYQLSTGPFQYCGLASMMFELAKIRTHNDLGHPLCANLRDGNWLANYIVARLKRRNSTDKLGEWLEAVFVQLYRLPHYSIPRYFDSIMLPLYTLIIDRTWFLSSDFVRNGDDFVRRLFLGGVALIGSQPTSPLPPLSSKSLPSTLSQLSRTQLPTIAAGLPHFVSGCMRNWGRDTFISLKGLTLLTGRFDVAKIIILGFGGTLRHGLIPNLLDGGQNSRYNCRDAVWWWLQAIKDYIQIVPNGQDILNDEVRRIFPTDDSPALLDDDSECTELLHQTMQQALTKHFEGIDFVERNAGTKIDAHMKTEGFNVKVGVNRDTGFVYGGNQWNCGTWMDKMGSSDKAGNRGHPATPRDGSAVEIIGLSKSVVTFLSELYEKKVYPSEGVRTSSDEFWSFKEWAQKIQDNFEPNFFVSEDCKEEHINRRGIYRDTVGATKRWMDFQLRPNFLITMTVAPELFVAEHASEALEIVDQHLLGPLGMKTLDPSDWNYRPDYDNSNDTTDYTVANGFNYHNGPEWLWPAGYYFMARLKFASTNGRNEIERINRLLSRHYRDLTQSEWFGLPELTNSSGSPCFHSCPIQAWSHSTILEALYLIKEMQRKNGSA